MGLCVFFASHVVFSQNARILASNSPNTSVESPTVLLKWYTDSLFYEEGVVIYRKKVSSLTWTKLNAEPLLRNDKIGDSLVARDSIYESFVGIVREATQKQLTESIFIINLLVLSFQDDEFADFLGLYYRDNSVDWGETYEYKIYRISGGREILIGSSRPIEVKPFEKEPPVDSFTVFQKEKDLFLDWRFEPERFYAINIYRTASDSLVEKKVNSRPVLLAEAEDSLGNTAYPSPKFKDVGLREGIEYTYQLEGLGFFGQPLQRTKPITLTLDDVTPPPPPINLEGKADSMKVHLKWENPTAPDVRDIKIFRSPLSDGPFESILSTTDQNRYDDSLSIPGPYYYYVSSFDHFGNEAPSRTIFVEVQDVIPPSSPKGLAIVADTGKLHLQWRANTEPDLAGYLLYRTVNRNDDKRYVLLNSEPLKENEYHQELPKNVKNEFFYYVVAVDTSYNKSKPSAFATGQMPDVFPPERPFIKTVSYTEEAIVLRWIPNVDQDLRGYRLERLDTLQSQEYSSMHQDLLSTSASEFIDREAKLNTHYFYRLMAYDSVGNKSLPSAPVYAFRKGSETDLAMSIEFQLKSKKKKKKKRTNLTWELTSEPSGFLGFVVYRGISEKALKPLTGLLQDKSFTDKNTSGNQYYYQIRGFLDDGQVVKSVAKNKGR